MPLDYDNIAFSSNIPAYQNFASGTFTVTVSGTLASGAQTSFTGSTSLSSTSGLIRFYASQNVSPGDPLVDYDNTALLHIPGYAGSSGPNIAIRCSVAGNPGVASISAITLIRFSPTTATASLYIQNPYGGTLTFTTTVVTFRYVAFLPTPLT